MHDALVHAVSSLAQQPEIRMELIEQTMKNTLQDHPDCMINYTWDEIEANGCRLIDERTF